MATIKSVKLSSCVRGERFKYTFGGDCKQYVALLTEDEYEKYKKNLRSVKRQLVSSPIVLISNSDDERLVIVRDLDGKDFPDEWKGSVRRYSPLIAIANIDKLPSIFKRRVKNATGTDADESMIQYWDENKNKGATIDLTKKTVVCPSC